MQRSALCRSRRELSKEYLLAKIGVDTAENEPLEVWGKIFNIIQSCPYPEAFAAMDGRVTATVDGEDGGKKGNRRGLRATFSALSLSTFRKKVSTFSASFKKICEIRHFFP